MSYTCYLISNKPEYVDVIKKSFHPANFEYYDGTGYESFSKLVNSCVQQCPTETVIMMSDKVEPKQEHLVKILELLEQGYGFVGLYRLAFFGFNKELFRKIGVMDERFEKGGYEDDDLYTRLQEANIATYLSQEVPYQKRTSAWAEKNTVAKNKQLCVRKWGGIPRAVGKAQRKMPEWEHPYDFGPSTGIKFKPWSDSVIQLDTGTFRNLKKVTVT
jgi:hypothetical protein